MRILLLLVITMLTVSCQKPPVDQPLPVQAENHSNVAYGTDAKQKMDIYLPAGRTDTGTKVIILIHGGAWTDGDKTDFADYITVLQQRLPGYAIFNVNYRLAAPGTNLFPSQENDIKAAIDFILNKSSQYKISNKIVLLGASAGAHLALLQGFKYTSPVKVKAVVSFFGPTDLVDMYNNPTHALVPMLLSTITGATPTSNATLYEQSSPANFVNAQNPPTLLLHGALDDLVDVSQASQFQVKLQAAGVINELVIYPNEGHGWFGTTLNDSFDRIISFLNQHVN